MNRNLKLTGAQDGLYIPPHGDPIENEASCVKVEIYRLYLRIIAGLLLGNTDMHFKNFAMFHTPQGLRLTPCYDQVSAAVYGYQAIALKICDTADLALNKLQVNHLIKLAEEFNLTLEACEMAYQQLAKNIESAKAAIQKAPFGTIVCKNKILQLMEKRWNSTFSLIGQALSKRR